MLFELPAGEDRLHDPTDALSFCESLGFSFFQPAEVVGFLSRLNRRSNQKTMDAGLDIFLGDGSLLAARHVGAIEEGSSQLDVQGVSFVSEGDGELWRVSYDGPAHILDNCRNAGDHEFWHKSRLERLIVELDFEASGGRIATDQRSAAFGQIVRARGEIWVSGDQYPIDTAALRQRSWDGEDFPVPIARRRIEARFEGGGALSLERRWSESGPSLTGWITAEGDVREIVSGRIETEPEADHPYPKALGISLVDVSKERYRIDAKVLHVAPLVGSANGVDYLSCQCLTTFDWGGIPGCGFAEYLHHLDESGNPLIPVDA